MLLAPATCRCPELRECGFSMIVNEELAGQGKGQRTSFSTNHPTAWIQPVELVCLATWGVLFLQLTPAPMVSTLPR